MHEAPSTPGVYAWYSLPSVKIRDAAAGELETVILQDLGVRRARSIRVSGRSDFGGSWSGSISEESLNLSASLKERLSNDMQRTIVANYLSETPLEMLAPLYIGKAKNLQTRLRQHQDALDNAKRAIQSGIEVQDENDDPGWLAARIASLGISLESLRVIVTEIVHQPDEDRQQIELAVETIEWFLNRYTQPILGRR